MSERARAVRAFLEANGLGSAQRRPLAGDASVRRYERIEASPPALLMDCPPDVLDVGPFMRVQGILGGLGYSVPDVLAADPRSGLLLIEDLGDDSFTRLMAGGADGAPLYAAAIDLLVDLQRRAPHDRLPAYDEATFMRELEVLPDWATPGLPDRARGEYREAWRRVLEGARVGGPCFVHVDYHADNLLWLAGREGHRRIGLLDFQDARAGPPAYDLVSLLEDARRDVPTDLAAHMIERYLGHRPELPEEPFRRSYAILGAQRNSKILGLFRRLARRDGKEHYLGYLPRVEAHLRRDLQAPALAPLRAWYEEHLLAG